MESKFFEECQLLYHFELLFHMYNIMFFHNPVINIDTLQLPAECAVAPKEAAASKILETLFCRSCKSFLNLALFCSNLKHLKQRKHCSLSEGRIKVLEL